MTQQSNFDIKALELDKILERVSSFAASEGGRNAILSLSPKGDLNDALKLREQTLCAYEMSMAQGAPPMRNVSDMRSAAAKAARGASLSVSELLRIRHLLAAMKELKAYDDKSNRRGASLDLLFGSLYASEEPQTAISRCIISEEEGISDHASVQLQQIRRSILRMEGDVRKKLDSLITSPTYQKTLQEPIVVQRSGRFVVPVKSEYRGNVPGLVHDTSGTGATLFIEPMAVVEMNNEIRILRAKEQEEIRRILAELSFQVGAVSTEIDRGYLAYCALDAIFAKAAYGISLKASFPSLNDKGSFVLRKARHPLIDKAAVVPVDMELRTEDATLVVTGPNTGGKTVTLKTIGLFPLMAQCGLMIPVAEQSEVPVFRKILADIGDEQNIEQSLSTFSSHMRRIVSIMGRSDENTLVLLDELGAGTDPVEGGALAVAILEKLKETGCKIAATTHYAEVKAYALRTPGVQNAGCEFDVESLRPTYRILMGVPGSSNAFSIAKRLGIEESVLAMAESHLDDKDKGFEEIIASLNEERKKVEQELERARSMTAQAEKRAQELKRQAEENRKNADREVEAAKRKAQSIIDKVTYQARVLEDELEKLKKERESDVIGSLQRTRNLMKNKMDRMYAAADPIGEDGDAAYTLPRPLKAGDIVQIRSLGQKGEVKEVNENGKTAMVSIGAIKTKVSFDDLKLEEQAPPRKKQRSTASVRSASKVQRSARNEVDLRGMTGEEAIMATDEFLNNCIMSGLHTATVIHGIGTGVLRQRIRQHLKRHPAVASSRPGLYGEGEDGVTIVELK